jgi:hypothetical protein
MKNKLTKSQYHESLSPAFVAWRKAMHKVCSVEFDMYCRLFTEKRTYGARTKYWYSKNDLPDRKIAKYIAQNPTFSAGSAGVFKVTFQPEYHSTNNHGQSIQSAALFCSKA